jgi:hypothetical protein
MRRSVLLSLLLAVSSCAAAFVSACDNDPTEASVVNDVPGATIEKAWFRTTLFTDPLETGQTSQTLRVGVGAEHAFAVVRINGHAFLARTNDRVDAAEAEQTRIVFSPKAARSLCFGEPRLSAEEQTDIAARIFPGDQLAAAVEECGAP